MKFQFEPDLDYQLEAIDAVCDLFRGQERYLHDFSVPSSTVPGAGTPTSNELVLSPAELHANLNAVQARNGLELSPAPPTRDFTVEMETGTGKTYVYLRTIFELNRRYGFSKFVIVVPSIAIREGVYKSIQVMESHLHSLYGGVPFEYFIYDSARLGGVRNFTNSLTIQIMIVTVGSINKREVNNLYKPSEETGGERPIDLIREVRPILIIDEPQSVDGGLGGRGRAALESMDPLCTLRYSATHIDEHQMVYQLDAVAAYERGLVKEVEVASATIESVQSTPYLRLLRVRNQQNRISARVEIDSQTDHGIQRREVTVHTGTDLESVTGREVYRGHQIGEIRVGRGTESIELQTPGGSELLRPGDTWGDLDPLVIQRALISRTIREHLDKSRELRPLGIKVLSLFFIDSVDRYRRYDSTGNAVKGPYAQIFEEEYTRLIRLPEYSAIPAAPLPDRLADSLHANYFSIDRRGGWTDTTERNQAGREAAERAYNLIMRDKEALLDLSTPLEFIFSHSALREGWDNPNVFQICTLREIHGERERRQTIGRGLRLSVNQSGERVRGRELNRLTVIATESYEEFAAGLQRELEGPGRGAAGRRPAGRVRVRDADERRRSGPPRSDMESPEFTEFWEETRGRTTYRLEFDNEALVRGSTRRISAMPPVSGTRVEWRKAELDIGEAGVSTRSESELGHIEIDDIEFDLPDLLAELESRTGLTRRTLVEILAGSGRLDEFRRSPQRFTEIAAELIGREMRSAIGRGLRYRRLDDGYFAAELIRTDEVADWLDLDTGEVEAEWANGVRLECRLPEWFRVTTPLGEFRPGRAVLVEGGGDQILYLLADQTL